MLRTHLPHLFNDDPNLRGRADALETKTYELVSFLADVLYLDHLVDVRADGPVTLSPIGEPPARRLVEEAVRGVPPDRFRPGCAYIAATG
jgi:hypothetical protein